jgi:hypothetical protein
MTTIPIGRLTQTMKYLDPSSVLTQQMDGDCTLKGTHQVSGSCTSRDGRSLSGPPIQEEDHTVHLLATTF